MNFISLIKSLNWFLIVCLIFSIIFFLFYFININLFNLLPSSIIVDFKELATSNEPLTQSKTYTVNYVNNNYLISDVGKVYIDSNTSLLNIAFPFSTYMFDIDSDFAKVVPIILGLKPY
jgi:hypothetical protein